MKYKKVMAILLALICTAAIALGGCSTRSQETGTLHSSVSEQGKNISSVGTSKDGTESQNPLSGSANTETDAKAKNDNANITSDNSDSGKSSENSSSSKTSGNSSSGKASGNSSSTSNSGSSKTSGNSSSDKASGSSGAKQPSSNSDSSTSNKTSASHSGSSGSNSSGSSGNSSKPSKPAHHHNWVQHYTTKTIPEVSHYEEVKKYVCNGCGAQFDDGHSAIAHCGADFWDDCENYTYKVVDSHKVVDQPAQTVKVPDYKYCTGCDARQ